MKRDNVRHPLTDALCFFGSRSNQQGAISLLRNIRLVDPTTLLSMIHCTILWKTTLVLLILVVDNGGNSRVTSFYKRRVVMLLWNHEISGIIPMIVTNTLYWGSKHYPNKDICNQQGAPDGEKSHCQLAHLIIVNRSKCVGGKSINHEWRQERGMSFDSNDSTARLSISGNRQKR